MVWSDLLENPMNSTSYARQDFETKPRREWQPNLEEVPCHLHHRRQLHLPVDLPRHRRRVSRVVARPARYDGEIGFRVEIQAENLEYTKALMIKLISEHTGQDLDTIARDVGYQNPFVFSTTFKRVMGWWGIASATCF